MNEGQDCKSWRWSVGITMAPVGIIGVGSYVPPKEMSNEDWSKIVDTSDEWISTKTGMKRRRIADDCAKDKCCI